MVIHQDQRYQTLIKTMETCLINDQMDTLREHLESLQSLAEAEQDDIGLAASYFYRSFLAYLDDNIQVGKMFTQKCLTLTQKKNVPYYEMKCYNRMFINNLNDADFHMGLKDLLKAYDIARIYPDFQYEAILLNNIGVLFAWLNEFATALDYLKQAYQRYFACGLDDRDSLASIIISIIEMHSSLNEYDEVEHWITLHPECLDPLHYSVIECIRLTNSIQKHLDEKEYTAVEENVRALVAITEVPVDYGTIFRLYLKALNASIHIKNEELSKSLIDIMEHLNKKSYIESFDYEYSNLKLLYLRAFFPREDSLETQYFTEYYMESMRTIVQFRQFFSRVMVVELQLYQYQHENSLMREENTLLQKNLELDAFTNLFNKTSTQGHVQRMLRERNEHTLQAMFLIDIDLFKQVNDIYGHGFGDVVLNKTADILKSFSYHKIIPGRFGGDEFLLFVSELESIEQVHQIANSILAQATSIVLPDNRIASITYSIGICLIKNSYDFDEIFLVSDNNLYEAKKNGRNQYIISDMV